MRRIYFIFVIGYLFLGFSCGSKKVYLTGGWRYHSGELKNFQEPAFNDSTWEKVSLPHTLRLERHYFKPGENYYRGVGLYRLSFSVFNQNGAKYHQGDRVLLHFEGILTRADVWLNGKYLGYHLGGYTPFSFDITDAFLPEKENLLAVRVDNSKMNVPPEGMLVDYTLFGGIYREVWVELKDPVYLENLFAYNIELNEDKALVKISAQARNTLDQSLSCKFSANLTDQIKGKEQLEEQTIAEAKKELIIAPGISEIELEMAVNHPKLWSPESPYLYQLVLSISCLEPRNKAPKAETNDIESLKDSISFNYGFRTFKFTNQGFFLNGKPLKLIGQNRHQSFPYLGNAGSFRLQYLDALLLKESGANFVRLSHYPQSPHFLEACDHLGLLVFEELPGWGYVGDREWKKLAEQALKEMILRDRNHPSIILWGVRINEAWWGEKWLEKMIQPAHSLDPTRPTSGARFLGNFRNMKEEVIAHNDYSGGLIKPPTDKPWIVSEYSVGATSLSQIPKSDAQQIATVRHNAYILDLILSEPSCSGSTGWAYADYNTFMSRAVAPDAKGRVRRHGMVDIFRLKKPIYFFYQAQSAKEPMVKIINQWWQKADFPGEVLVVGNCEQVRLILNGKEIDTRFPDKEYSNPKTGKYLSLPHPPFSFSGFKFEPGELVAQCLFAGEVKAKDKIQTPASPAKIQLELGEEFSRIMPETDFLISDDVYSDPIRVIARLTDEKGNLVKENKAQIKFSVSEYGKIIGQNPFPLENGIAVVFFKKLKEPDLADHLPEKGPLKLEIKIKAELISEDFQIPPAETSVVFVHLLEDEVECLKLLQKTSEDKTQQKKTEECEAILTRKNKQKENLRADYLKKSQEDLFSSPELILRKLFLQALD